MYDEPAGATAEMDSAELLLVENSILKRKLDKLTSELGRQLEEHVTLLHDCRKCMVATGDEQQGKPAAMAPARLLSDRYGLLTQNVMRMTAILDLKGRYVYLNEKMAEFYGMKPADLVGQTAFNCRDQGYGQFLQEKIFDPVVRTKELATGIRNHSEAGRSIHVSGSGYPVRDDAGNLIGVAIVTDDLTGGDRKAQYQTIEQSINLITSFSDGLEHTIRKIFRKLCLADCITAGGIYLKDDKRQALHLICHYNLPDEFVASAAWFPSDTQQYELVEQGKPVYNLDEQLIVSKPQLNEAIGTRAVSVIPLNHDGRCVGSLNFILDFADQITDTDKAFLETIAWRIARIIGLHETRAQLNRTVAELNETISDLKVKQQILIQKSKMESLGELSAGMAHEINQPLVIISLAIENILHRMSLGKGPNEPYLKRKFDSILMNVGRIQQIIDNMRIFARDQSTLRLEKVRVAELVEKTMEMVAVQYRAEGIKIITDQIDAGAQVFGNLPKLEQVLINLLSNSRYAVNERARIADGKAYQKSIELKAIRSGATLHLEVSDNGIGIPDEHLDKLFTPFFTTKKETAGTGLGLSIVYGIVKEMNGDIHVSSRRQEYTLVRVSLPSI